MNKIKVPYIPIDSFDESKIVKEFLEATQEENNGTVKVNPGGEKLPESMVLILYGMGMEKYVELFEREKISLETLLQMDESDLEEIGIADKEDRTLIIKNLGFHKRNTKKFVISENHLEDLQIIKNVSKQLLLLQHYCSYLNLQMKKHKLRDFRINSEESACTYLKAFTESALIQTQILCCRIYDKNNSEALISKLLKIYNLNSPKILLELLPKKKRKRSKIFDVVIIISFASFFVITGKYLIKRW